MKIRRAITAAMLAAAAICASSTPVYAASCWSAEEVAAAKIRDLQTRMMVAGLKCRGDGPEMLAAYNRFVVVHRTSIQRHNNILRGRFIRIGGKSGGERDYDRYTTAMANAYGSTEADHQACREVTALARRAASAKPVELVAIAEDYGLQPKMAGGSCPMRMASTR